MLKKTTTAKGYLKRWENIIIHIFNTLKQFNSYNSMTYKAYKDSFWKIKPSEKFHTLLEIPSYSEAKKEIDNNN